VGRDTSQLFSEAEDSVCRSSQRTRNVSKERAELALRETFRTESSDGGDARQGGVSMSEDREVPGTKGDSKSTDNEGSETGKSKVSETAESEISEFTDNKDSEIVDSKGSEVADSWNCELADSSARSGRSEARGGGVSRLFSKAGDSVCRSSWRSSNITEELVERPLRETSETEPSDDEDSREGRDSGPEDRGLSETSEDWGKADNEDLMITGREDPKIVDNGGSEITST